MSCDSNLDELFELNTFKDYTEPSILFSEEYGGNIEQYYEKELRNYNFFEKLLNNEIGFDKNSNFQLKGWFYNVAALPDISFFDEVTIKNEYIQQIKEKSYIYDRDSIVIHYRGTDFKYHSIRWGDLRLQEEYYVSALNNFAKSRNINKIIIVSDEPAYIKDCIKYDVDIIIENNSYLIDWMLLFSCKNLICSNYSFCYTAGSYNKEMVYQPYKFLTRYLNTEVHFPPNPYFKNAIQI